MTEKYTPERVAELVAEARSGNHLATRPSLVFDLADALTAVSADSDRLHKAITEALDELGDPEGKGPWLSGNIPNAVRRILRAALDKEKSDDE